MSAAAQRAAIPASDGRRGVSAKNGALGNSAASDTACQVSSIGACTSTTAASTSVSRNARSSSAAVRASVSRQRRRGNAARASARARSRVAQTAIVTGATYDGGATMARRTRQAVAERTGRLPMGAAQHVARVLVRHQDHARRRTVSHRQAVMPSSRLRPRRRLLRLHEEEVADLVDQAPAEPEVPVDGVDGRRGAARGRGPSPPAPRGARRPRAARRSRGGPWEIPSCR